MKPLVSSRIFRHPLFREGSILLGFALLTALMTWPWVLHWRNAVSDKGDPYIIAWTLWWDFHQTFHNPLHLFDANIFYPYSYTLAFGEHDYGISLLFFPLYALGFTPLAVHCIATLSGYAISGYGAFRLARTLTNSVAAACITGLVFAFCPYHMFKVSHLHYMFSCWIPLTLEALILFSRERTWRRAIWLGTAFLMNGLTCISWLLLTAIPFAFATIILLLKNNAERDLNFWKRGAATVFIAILLLLPFFLPYYWVSKTYGFKRSEAEAEPYSAKLENWIVVDERNKLWQGIGLGKGIPYNSETALFPGFAPILFSLLAIFLAKSSTPLGNLTAAAGDDSIPHSKVIIRVLDLSVLATAFATILIGSEVFIYSDTTITAMLLTVLVLARCSIAYPAFYRNRGPGNLIATLRAGTLPEAFTIGLLFTIIGFAGSFGTNFFFHRFLYRFVPLFDSMRVPARWAMICDLGLAILAGLGVLSLIRRFSSRQRIVWIGIFCFAVAAILFEQRIAPVKYVEGEAEPDQLALYLKVAPMRGGIVELPTGENGNDYLYTLRAADHGRPLITSSNSFLPPIQKQIIELTNAGKIPYRLLDLLESVPASYVAIHYDLLDPVLKAHYEEFLSKGLMQKRLVFLRTFNDRGRIDLYAMTKTEPDLISRGSQPPPLREGKLESIPAAESPIDAPAFFVTQQYHDFLDRDPDVEGYSYWLARIKGCGESPACQAKQRVVVATAFSLEPEFSEMGGFILRLYYAAYGRRPTFEEFVRERKELSADFGSDSSIERFLTRWTQQAHFKQAYAESLSGQQFLSKLLGNAELPLDTEGEYLIKDGNLSDVERSRILKDVVTTDRFKQRTANEAFLLMQYFSLLRRDPDSVEFANRLRDLGNGELNARQNTVSVFLNSEEYRARFASPTNH